MSIKDSIFVKVEVHGVFVTLGELKRNVEKWIEEHGKDSDLDWSHDDGMITYITYYREETDEEYKKRILKEDNYKKKQSKKSTKYI